MHFVAAIDAVGGLRPVLGLHETVCSGAAGASRACGQCGHGPWPAAWPQPMTLFVSAAMTHHLSASVVRHEPTPGPADGYGRMAGKPALTLLHLGPGLSNALANLHNARRAGTPLVNLVGAGSRSFSRLSTAHARRFVWPCRCRPH